MPSGRARFGIEAWRGTGVFLRVRPSGSVVGFVTPKRGQVDDLPALPGGTVTFLFSDIEGSTRLLRQLRGEYGAVLSKHARIMRDAFARFGGREVDTQGDSFFAVFSRARDAVGAAVELQRAMAAALWPQDADVRVRVGVHTGEPEMTDERYVGLDVHRAARICAAGHGGQVLVSQLSAALAGDQLPEGVSLRPLGAIRLKDLVEDEQLSELVMEGLPSKFPPLRSVDEAPFDTATDVLAAEVERPIEPTGKGIDVFVLGPVEVHRDGQSVTVGAAKQRMILAALALRLGEAVSTDSLIDTLWGNRPPATATKALQVYVSELRRLIEPDRRTHGAIATQPPGYRLMLGPERTDLGRFERMWREGRDALAQGRADDASALLRDALGLWRGTPLTEFRYEDAFAGEIGRLEELRATCTEDRIDADLAVGQHHQVVPELERLVEEHPLRERVHAQLMLALYRSGRQADALAVYQRTRDRLVEEFGIDPSPALVTIERQILQQDVALELARTEEAKVLGVVTAAPTRTLVVVCQASRELDSLAAFAKEITEAGADRDLVLTRVVTTLPGRDSQERLGEITRRLSEYRDRLLADGVTARVAAFSTTHPAEDLLKLATHQNADMLLIDGGSALIEGRSGLVDQLLAGAECDVALHLGRSDGHSGQGLLVPFSGNEHDWAALELAAMLARRTGTPLVIAGADVTDGRDASRLLATASLVIQRTTNIVCEPLLIPPGAAGVLEAAAGVAHVVVGLSPRFREEGLGQTRYRIAHNAPSPVTFIRRGSRPGVLAPPDTLTRFAWSLTTSRA